MLEDTLTYSKLPSVCKDAISAAQAIDTGLEDLRLRIIASIAMNGGIPLDAVEAINWDISQFKAADRDFADSAREDPSTVKTAFELALLGFKGNKERLMNSSNYFEWCNPF